MATTEGFHKRLIEARERSGLSMSQLAERAGLTQPTITGYESKMRVPDISTAAQLAEALDVDVCWLAYGIKSEAGQALRMQKILERALREVSATNDGKKKRRS